MFLRSADKHGREAAVTPAPAPDADATPAPSPAISPTSTRAMVRP